MSTGLTPQQRTAVEHRGSSVVLASGAGCGKTHVLTLRYLSHLTTDGASVPQVVAITFTERAAREMRDRIRKAIEKLSDPHQHLRDLESAPITTIHGFCGTLLRQYAVPAGLDPGFEIIDDVLTTGFRTEAIHGSLRELLEGRGPAPAAESLRELIVLFGWNAVVEAVDGLLLSVDRAGWEAWLARKTEGIAAEWADSVRAALLPDWVGYMCAATGQVAGCLFLLARVRSPNPQVNRNIDRILTETPQLHGAPDLAAAIKELTELAKVGRTGKKDWPDEAVYQSVKDTFTAFRGDLPKRLALFTDVPQGLAEAVRLGQGFLRVAIAADDEYRRRKRRAGMLDFQDLLVSARDLLRDREDVRQSLRSRFRFVLLDELQDTDPVQMELVELLCGAGLVHGSLFAVGDHKQSIYRFRGAEVSLFQQLRAAVAAEGRLGLTRNFRSQPGVLHFVNALFSRRIQDYEPLESHHPAVSAAENVEFLWTQVEHSPQNAEHTVGEIEPEKGGDGEGTGSSPRAKSAAIRAAEAAAIAGRISELLDDPTPRVLERDGSARRVERRDVVLLFRSMSHVAIYESALRRCGLDYYLVGGRAFFAQQEVYDLLNVLRAIENPQDGASLVGALRSPFCGLSDEAVFLLGVHADGIWAGLNDPRRRALLPADQVSAAERAGRLLTTWRDLKDRLTLSRLLNTIIADTGYDAGLQFEFLGDRKLANLWKLVDLARSFDRSGLFGLPEFVARLADLVARQPREEQAATLPESADVVRLMSIHQSKGLEFPVVFVPDLAVPARGDIHPVARWHRGLGCLVRLPAEFENLPDGESPPFPDFAHRLGRTVDQLADWQEDLRILYVACTRARDLLILSAGLPGTVEDIPANHWTLTLRERFDLRTGQCLSDDLRPDDRPRVRVRIAGSAGSEFRWPSTIETAPPPVPQLETQRSTGLRPLPRVIALAAIERVARGEPVPTLGPDPGTEPDPGRSSWRHPRDHMAPLTPPEAALWSVLDRWDFADVDGWGQLLTDATEDERVAHFLRPRLRRLAESDLRTTLAAHRELHRGVEFLADLRAFGGPDTCSVIVRGVIDILYRDMGGWHVLGIDLGTNTEDDPWRGRRPGLVLQAWACRESLGGWPATVQLFDLETGEWVQAQPRRFRSEQIAAGFAAHIDTWQRRGERG